MGERFYRRMFLAGAIWNLAGGVAILALTGWIFGRQGLEAPHPPAYYHAWIALFMTFGLGYLMIWRDMYGNKNLVLLGAIGKIAFAVIFIANMLLYPGQVPGLFWIPIIGDLIFAALYGRFLVFAGRRDETAP